MVTVNFAEDGKEENIVNENLKNHFISKIDKLFSNIFIDNEQFYQETKNRYAIAILVQSYKDFFTR